MNRALWIAQGLLAALFLFAGGSKLVTPAEVLAAMSPFPASFILFIGVCEVLGAFGLVLPMLTKIRPELTFLAALGLTVIMVGATVSTLPMGVFAAIPLAITVLTALVAYGRRNLFRIERRGSLSVTPA
jgi:hypothetical protein